MFRKILFALLPALCLLGFGVAGAQPLATLAPEDTVLSLSMNWQGSVLETLDDDLNALGWEQGKETLRKLFDVGARLDSDFKDALELYQGMLDGSSSTSLPPEVLDACPGLQAVSDAAQDYRGKAYKSDALLTLSLSPFSPIPAGTALLRIDDSLAPLYEQLQSALLECATASADVTVTELDEGGVTLYVVGDAGDFPIVAGNVGTLYFLGSNPEVIRGVVRKANGAAEPSFADTPFYRQVSAKLSENVSGLGFTVNLAALADPLQGAASFMGSDPETAYLLSRADALLRTLGGIAGTLSLTDEGVRYESVLAVNPEGGDEALLKLLLCQTCTVSTPFLAPEGSVGVATEYLPWRELYAYAQDWTDGLEAVTGERVDLKQLVQDNLGLNLDTALFDWLGSEVQTYTLESISPDLRTLVYSPAKVSVIPVSSPEAAAAGLEDLGRTLGPILNELLSETGGMGDAGGMENLFAGGLLGETAVTTYTYKDVEVTRLRAGFNTDLGYAFVGNYFVVGSPAKALESVVDAFQGARSFTFDSSYQSLRADLPESLSSFRYSDTSATLNGLADLLEVFVQPAAFAAGAGLKAAIVAATDSSSTSDLGYADLYDVTPKPLSVPATVEATLSEDDLDSYGSYTVYYELTDLTPGAQVSVSLSSDTGNAYLSLVDADAETYLAQGEYGDDYTSNLTFSAEEGRRYLVEITNYDDISESGDYSLEVSAAESTSDTSVEASPEPEPLTEADVPTFKELLELFDLLPQSVRVVADHTSTSEGYSEVDGNTVYSHSLTRVRW